MVALLVGEKWLVVPQVHRAFSHPRALPMNKILNSESGSILNFLHASNMLALCQTAGELGRGGVFRYGERPVEYRRD